MSEHIGAARRLCRRSAATMLVGLILLIGRPAAGGAAENLLQNGAFRVGSGDSVDGWRTEAWVQDEGTTEYHWIPPKKGEPGEVEVFSHRDNDARWQQPISLAPGWYYISAETRTRGVLGFSTGANISILDGCIASADLRGDSEWQRLGFYLRVGPRGADIDICMRLGGYGNLQRGQAFFRNARIEAIAAPPADARLAFDLDEVRKSQMKPPHGRFWSVLAVLALLSGLAAAGWWLMLDRPPAPARPVEVPVAPPIDRRRKRARAR